MAPLRIMFLNSAPGHPALLHVLLLGFPVGFALGQPGGQVHVEPLAGRAVRAVQEAEQGQLAGPQPGLLGQFEPGQVLGIRWPPGQPPCGKAQARRRTG